MPSPLTGHAPADAPAVARWGDLVPALVGVVGLVVMGDLRLLPLVAVVWILMWGAAVLVAPTPAGGAGRVFGAAVVVRALLLMSPATLSDDLYRYLWEGRVVEMGGNPYLHAPADPVFADFFADPIRLLVNHPDVSTIYPPLALWLFAGLATIAQHPLVVKAFMGLCDAATAGVLAQILIGRRMPLRGAWLYALLPLAAVESAGSGHLEAAAILCVVLAIRAWDRGGSGVGFAGLGALLKLLPGALMLGLMRRRPALVLLVLGLAVVSAMPFVPAGAAVGRGFSTYAQHWSFNGSVFPLVEAVFGELARPLCLVAGAAVTGWALLRRRDPAELALWVGGAFVLLSPTVHPWYIPWVWVPAIVCGVRAWTVLAGLAPIAYVVLATTDPSTGAWQESRWPALVAYGSFAVVWIWDRMQGLVQPGPRRS